MKKSELIKELKKITEDVEVGFSCRDNAEYEIQGWAFSVELVEKRKITILPFLKQDIVCLDDMPEKWIVIRT